MIQKILFSISFHCLSFFKKKVILYFFLCQTLVLLSYLFHAQLVYFILLLLVDISAAWKVGNGQEKLAVLQRD